jgi:hypothetical protein
LRLYKLNRKRYNMMSKILHDVCVEGMMHRGTNRYTHSNPPLDMDQLGGQVVKTSAQESRNRGFESPPSPGGSGL